MALTQMQLIQSLGEAMTWFEREMSWGVPPTALPHLCGRIGELYAALITNGQMAIEVTQKGYDVVSAEGEKISVKTTAMMGSSGHVSFNANTLSLVDRVMVLRINSEEMQIETLLDVPLSEAIDLMATDSGGKRTIGLSKLTKKPKIKSVVKSIREVPYQDFVIREMENGSIEAERDGEMISPVKPLLRELAIALNIGILNSNGNPQNTRQLGSQIIKTIEELNEIVPKRA